MRFVRALVVLIVLALFVPTAPAHAFPAQFSVGSFSASYSGGAMHIQFTLKSGLGIYGWLNYNWPDEPQYVYVWRQKISDPCVGKIYVATSSWINVPGFPFVTADFTDAGVEPGTTYQYYVTGVSAQLGILSPDAFIGCASTGPGLLCRGTLASPGDCGISGIPSAIPCDNSCSGNLIVNDVPNEVWAYFNTPTTLAIYGEVNGLIEGICNVAFPAFKITSVVEQSCVTAVEPTTWGAVKGMYR